MVFDLDTPNLMELFEEEQPSRMRAAYLNWVRTVAEAKWLEHWIRELPWWWGASNAEEITPQVPNFPVETHDRRRLVEDRPSLKLTQILRAFCETTGLDLDDLCSRRKHAEIAHARRDLTAIAIGRFDHRVCDLTNLLSKTAGSFSRRLTIADRHINIDPGYRSNLDRLEQRLTENALKIVRL